MQIDTEKLRSIASSISNHQYSYYGFTDLTVNRRHQSIQNALSSLSSYFYDSAQMIENSEASLLRFGFDDVKVHVTDGKWTAKGAYHINSSSIMTRKGDILTASGTVSGSIKKVTVHGEGEYINGTLSAAVGDCKATGNARLALWENGQFDPQLKLNASATMSVVSATGTMKVGTDDINVQGKVTGTVGTVYARGHAVVSKDELIFEAGVGGAALRGEAQIAFNIFGFRIIISGSASVGSAEANVSYRHSSREWEFGTKLAFIAGLGFRINVSH